MKMRSLSLAPYPPPSIRGNLVPDEWALCIESWLLLTRRLLSAPPKNFALELQEQSAVQFLASYAENSPPNDDEIQTTNMRVLSKYCFLLTHRTLSQLKPPPAPMLEYSFLARICLLFGTGQSLTRLLEGIWTKQDLANSNAMLQAKLALTRLLESSREASEVHEQLLKAVAFAKAVPSFGQYLLTGTDFIDAVADAYKRSDDGDAQKKLAVLAYVCFESFMNQQKPRLSSLLDACYNLESTSLMKAVVSSTPFLAHLKVFVADKGAHSIRAKPLLETLASHKPTIDGRPRKPITQRVDKGKRPAHAVAPENDRGHVAHAHRMSIVSQLQDLFPDLGTGFIVKLLDEYDDNLELVTAHLLENSLPIYLQDADRSEALSENGASITSNHNRLSSLPPRSTPHLPPSRRNIHDNDDFDRLAISASNLHLGRKDADLTADKLLATGRPSSHKAAILSALAAFDSDDDERDDTYDVADVGGTVDTTFAGSDADTKQDSNEGALFIAFKTSREIFERNAETRRSKGRASLRTVTGMTDEAIEGWAIMADRDPRRLLRLERRHEMGSVQQRALIGSSWTADSGTDGTEDSDIAGAGDNIRGGFRGGKGRGSGGRGRGGNVAGSSDDRSTQVARLRKDANKGSRANHNRRDQRARKMARGDSMAG